MKKKIRMSISRWWYMLGKRIEDGEFPYWFKSTKKLKRIIKECDNQCAYGCPHAQKYYSRETGSFSGAVCKIYPVIARRDPMWLENQKRGL
jgi:hypothetical protein